MAVTHIRQFDCGHVEQLRPDSPTFPWCFKCGQTGVTIDYLKCSMPTCKLEASRVIRYASGRAYHYCDKCRPLAACDEDNVLTERRFTELSSSKED